MKYTRTVELEKRQQTIIQQAYKQGLKIQGFHFGEYVTAKYMQGLTKLYNYNDKGHEVEFLETHYPSTELIKIKIVK